MQYFLKCVNLVNQRVRYYHLCTRNFIDLIVLTQTWFSPDFQLSQDHITLVDNELRFGQDPNSIAQDIAGVLVIEQDQGSDSKNRQFLMDIEMKYETLPAGAISYVLQFNPVNSMRTGAITRSESLKPNSVPVPVYFYCFFLHGRRLRREKRQRLALVPSRLQFSFNLASKSPPNNDQLSFQTL